MFKHILVATDLRPRSEEVLCGLGSMDPGTVGRITLLHVLDERSNGHPLDEEGQDRLSKQKARLEGRGFRVEAITTRGVPFDVIVHEAQVREASLTVIGRGDNPRWLSGIMGETVLRVLELCPCPVLVCHGERPARPLFEDVVLGVDFSNEAHHALQALKKLARENPGTVKQVTLVHVHEQKNIDLLLKLVNKEQIEQIVALEQERLEEMVLGLKASGIPDVSVRMRTGKPVDEILADIEENRPTLVVLGAQGQGRSEMYRIGTTAFRVAQMASCGVLVIPLSRPALPF
ncbi:MAG: universal stress protein [Synergistaceae bacterium]|nr:universal stress protein [Synergistaceae bacterium]